MFSSFTHGTFRQKLRRNDEIDPFKSAADQTLADKVTKGGSVIRYLLLLSTYRYPTIPRFTCLTLACTCRPIQVEILLRILHVGKFDGWRAAT
jgi:hypothetical protein